MLLFLRLEICMQLLLLYRLLPKKETMNPKAIEEEYQNFLSSTEVVGGNHKQNWRNKPKTRQQRRKSSFNPIPLWNYPGTSQVN